MANTLVTKINPYIKVEKLYLDCIEYVAKDLTPKPPAFPKTNEIIDKICEFLKKEKLFGSDYDFITQDATFIIVARAINNSLNFGLYIKDSEIPHCAQIYVIKLYNLIDDFRQGDNLYNYQRILVYSNELTEQVINLEREILNSDIEGDYMILPLTSISILKSSISFYKSIYDTGGTTIKDTNYVNVFQSTIAGAVIGAVEAFKYKESYNSIITGCVAGSVGASLNNSWGQELWFNTSPAKLPLEY